MTDPTTLDAAREAVAIDTRSGASATGRPSDWKDSDMTDMDRLAALTHKHAHEWARALLAAHEENQRLLEEDDQWGHWCRLNHPPIRTTRMDCPACALVQQVADLTAALARREHPTAEPEE